MFELIFRCKVIEFIADKLRLIICVAYIWDPKVCFGAINDCRRWSYLDYKKSTVSGQRKSNLWAGFDHRFSYWILHNYIYTGFHWEIILWTCANCLTSASLLLNDILLFSLQIRTKYLKNFTSIVAFSSFTDWYSLNWHLNRSNAIVGFEGHSG